MIDLRACNFMHAETSLRPHSMYARHCARNLSSPVQGSKIYLRWSSLLLTANYCPKQLHYHRCLWQSWIGHWKLYRKIETFLTVLNEDNTDALTHYLQTLNLDITEHIRILKSYDYFLLLTWYKHSVTGIL